MEDNVPNYELILPTMKTMRRMYCMGVIGSFMNMAVFAYVFLAGFHVIDETGTRDAIAISSHILGFAMLFIAFYVAMSRKHVPK